MAGTIIGEIDMVEEIMLCSDKCGVKELQKLDEEFQKELMKTRKSTYKLSIWRLIKDDNSMQKQMDGGEVTAPSGDSNENVISQNPKLNYQIVPGIAKQIQFSKQLYRFHLVNFRFNQREWKRIGKAINDSISLRVFCCQACNLYQSDNFNTLIMSLLKNTSLEVLDFSDSDLTDAQGEVITTLMRKQGEERDNVMWQNSLR